MKTCPTCARVYSNDALRFCRYDGAPLAAAPEDETRLLYSEEAIHTPPPRTGGVSGEVSGGVSDGLGAHAAAAASSSLTAPMPPQRRRASRRKAIDSLAVLPFANEGGAGGGATTGYLSDGITESIINSLSQLPRLRVLPRSTVFRYRGPATDPQEAGRLLGVRAVVTGRVAEVGGWLVIRTELIDVWEESQLWGEQYRREPADIFALQEEISRDISEKLRLKLSGEDRRRLSKRYTDNTDAYRAYLQGRHYLFARGRTADWIKKGIDCLQRAIDLDPNYALAYSGLAEAHGLLASSTGEQPPREAYPKAQAAARKALALDPSLAEAHTALGFSLLLYDYDLEGARRALRRALKLNPNHPNAHDGLAFYYNATRQSAKSVAECEESRRLDPLSPFSEVNLGWAHYFARRFDAAAAQGRKALEMDDRFAFAHWITGLALAQAGDADGAVESLERGVETSGGGLPFRAHLAYAYARSGRVREARGALADLEEAARGRYVSAYYFAITRLGLGETDAALEQLELALEERAGFLAFLPVEPIFDPLRDDARFRRLVERAGLKS